MGTATFKNKKIPIILAAGFVLFILIYTVWIGLWSITGSQFKLPRLGIDSCVHCGMIINDDHFWVVEPFPDEQDNIKNLFFDDIGCFLTFASQHPKPLWQGKVRDFETLELINISEAYYFKTQIQTPMGSGWIVRKNQDKKNTGQTLQQIQFQISHP